MYSLQTWSSNGALVLVVLAALLSVRGDNLNAQVVLRDHTIIRESVKSFDESGVLLSNGRRLSWDLVLQANVDDSQGKFDQMIRTHGLPLFRLKARIANGDWIAAGKVASPIYDDLVKASPSSFSNPLHSYLVSLAVMNARLNEEDPLLAIEPFLIAVALKAKVPQSDLEKLAANYLLTEKECEMWLSSKLIPVCTDKTNAKKVLLELMSLIDKGFLPRKLGVVAYLAMLATESGNLALAESLIGELKNEAKFAGWAKVLESHRLIASGKTGAGISLLDSTRDDNEQAVRVAALFVRGKPFDGKQISDFTSSEISNAKLSYLKVSALHGKAYPQLAAASLYHCAELARKTDRQDEFAILRKELLLRYPSTYHGRLANSQQK